MQRRRFLKLLGAGTAGAVIVPLLPNMPAMAATPMPIPHTHDVEELTEKFHQLVADDLTDRIKSGEWNADYEPHRNPYRITNRDLGLFPRRDLQ